MHLFAIFLFFQILFRFVYCANIKNVQAWKFNEQRVSKNAEIIIQKIKGSGTFYLMIQNKKQYKDFFSKGKLICNASVPSCDFISTWLIDTAHLPQSFPINPNQGGGKYYFVLYNCYFPISISSITFSFLNTWGRLPFEKYPLIYICWIESGFYLVLFILCLVNSLKHRSIQVLLHFLIIGTVFIYTLSIIVSALLFTYTNSKNKKLNDFNQEIISLIASALLCLRNFCLLMLILFLVSGLSIIYEQIKTIKIFLIIGMSAIFAISEFLLDSLLPTTYSFGIHILVSIIFVVIYVLYAILLINLSNHSMNTIDAHIAMIYNSNIDPETTPTFRKRELLELCRKCAISILLIFVISSIMFRMGVFYYFISYLIVEVAMSILLSIICWSCRLRYKMAATYCDDEEAYYVKDAQNQDQNLVSDLDQNVVTYQYKYSADTGTIQGKSQDQHENQVKINPSNKDESQTKSQSQGQLDGQMQGQFQIQKETQNMAAALTASDNINNCNEDDNLSLSSSLSKKGNSDEGFESDKAPQTQNGKSGSNGNENVGNSLKQWQYGMMLPPMPQEEFSLNQVHPKD